MNLIINLMLREPQKTQNKKQPIFIKSAYILQKCYYHTIPRKPVKMIRVNRKNKETRRLNAVSDLRGAPRLEKEILQRTLLCELIKMDNL